MIFTIKEKAHFWTRRAHTRLAIVEFRSPNLVRRGGRFSPVICLCFVSQKSLTFLLVLCETPSG
jgi:hypothetical protein